MRTVPSPLDAMLKRIPSAAELQIKATQTCDEALMEMPFHVGIIGNPKLPAIHGGALCGFMLASATAHITAARPATKLPRAINISIDYLRPALSDSTFASVCLIRLGRRIAHVQVKAWQADRHKPIALMRANFVLMTDVASTGDRSVGRPNVG